MPSATPQPSATPLPPVTPLPSDGGTPFATGAPGPEPLGGVDLRRGVRISLTTVLTLALLGLLLLAAARFQQRGALGDVLAEGAVLGDETADKANQADTFFASVSLVAAVLGLGTAGLWAVWFRRVRLNAEALAPGTHRFGSGWAAGAWFTPVVNLWFPKQIANDIYRASAPAGPQGAPKGLLNAWWVSGLVAGALTGASAFGYALTEAKMRRDFRLERFDAWEADVRNLRTLAGASAFGYLLCAVAGALALLVVRQLTRMQEERALERMGFEGFAGAGGPYTAGGPYPVADPYAASGPYAAPWPYPPPHSTPAPYGDPGVYGTPGVPGAPSPGPYPAAGPYASYPPPGQGPLPGAPVGPYGPSYGPSYGAPNGSPYGPPPGAGSSVPNPYNGEPDGGPAH
ncbi:hypothetical protein H340_13491 [Streptomyces mobaraensis NBRC 13819 = DSM 40847]|uniref:DUF4328 domain-containing protein n=1 Tax=Streptomyces mobaraensis (strain ATCC 29032 / DSM 40847 / JCM 4168 / NBRC 13819 / NCIMB 11159 / IPCR 16-22) TaxID=1223523 RepID=M3A4J8_STRM1|nr:hypothetical protein H340_13491 [Streptomyces mobaraensis NBRC 13819 = DSM 40847]